MLKYVFAALARVLFPFSPTTFRPSSAVLLARSIIFNMKTFTALTGLLPSIAVLVTGRALPALDEPSTLETRQSCALPSTYRWTDTGGPLTQPANGWVSIKDFTVSQYNGQYIVYGSNYNGNAYGSFGKFSAVVAVNLLTSFLS